MDQPSSRKKSPITRSRIVPPEEGTLQRELAIKKGQALFAKEDTRLLSKHTKMRLQKVDQEIANTLEAMKAALVRAEGKRRQLLQMARQAKGEGGSVNLINTQCTRNASFHYSSDQVEEIHQALQRAGIPRDADWARCLDVITTTAREALTQRSRKPLPYLGNAVNQLTQLAKAVDSALKAYGGLVPELRLHLDTQLEQASALTRLNDSPALLAEAALVLLSSYRLEFIMNTVHEAAKLAADSLPTMTNFWPIPRTGRRKNEEALWFVQRLCGIYQEATGERPKVYYSAHQKHDYYAGKFYDFAKAALGPLDLAPQRYLGHSVYRACKEYRQTLPDKPRRQSLKRVKSPHR